MSGTWTRPVWSLRLRKVREPWRRWRATQPQRRTRLPRSSVDKWPQKLVRVTHWRELELELLFLLRGCGGLGLGILWVSLLPVVEAEETKKRVRVVLGKGLKMKERRRGRVLRRRRDIMRLTTSLTEWG